MCRRPEGKVEFPFASKTSPRDSEGAFHVAWSLMRIDLEDRS
jgi:hypothetical protein